jgi:hypothetical protein
MALAPFPIVEPYHPVFFNQYLVEVMQLLKIRISGPIKISDIIKIKVP